MIIQSKETKTQSSLLDLLKGNAKTQNTKSNDLFAKLLSTFGEQTPSKEPVVVKSTDFKTIIDPKTTAVKSADTKTVNSPVTVTKNTDTKATDTKSAIIKELQSLLGGSEEKESSLISKELLGIFSDDQVRTLIHKAKEYLKNEITQKAPEYQADTSSLPKTLLGLVQLAQKLKLEPQSISLSTLVHDESQDLPTLTPELLSKPLLEAKILAALPTTAAATATTETTPFEAITQLLNEGKGKEQKTAKTSATEPLTQHMNEKSEFQPLKALLQTMDKHESLLVSTPTITTVSAAATEAIIPKDEKTPQHGPHNPKTESLLTLLQGTHDSNEPKSEGANSLKIEGDPIKAVHTPKADSIEVKSKEAQQSMRLFAGEIKEAVQEYKPPFTRLTMKLNPEKLGEVEVTLVQRGNNVHVNIQSNNTSSVAFLAHNATELKAQLAQQGITNATMNFMSGGEGQSNQQMQQQQHHEQRQNAFRSYESFEELELNEEQLCALEIIIPHYA